MIAILFDYYFVNLDEVIVIDISHKEVTIKFKNGSELKINGKSTYDENRNHILSAINNALIRKERARER